MRFRTKIIVIYAIFALITASIMGISYYDINARQYKENERIMMENMSGQFLQYLDETIDSMNFVFSYILSDSKTVDALVTLSSQPTNDLEDFYFSEAGNIIRSKLTTDYIVNNYHRVIVFNNSGSILTGKNIYIDSINYNTDLAELPWIERMENTKGKPVLIGKHIDDWGTRGETEVISLVKQLQGMSMGYIEVQKNIDDLENIFRISNENIDVVVVSGDEIIYSSKEDRFDSFYIEGTSDLEDGIHEVVNTVTGKKELLSISYSQETDAYVAVVQDVDVITGKLIYILPITILITGCFLLISIIFIVLVSIHLTKPIRKMTELMEETDFENLQTGIDIDHSRDDEIQQLNRSYQNVLKRLNISITKEKRLSYLQLQAQFDLLQTQVNPHFLYNVLNVISNRGIVNRDEVICDICQSLADILRYATNTKERYAPIRAELAYLDQYFYLLKSRYKHKLEYKMEVAEEIQDQIIPKIALQQIVENSIAHGYENVSKVMVIEITGWEENGRWYVKVKDNGEGFREDKLKELEQKMSNTRKRLLDNNDSIEMEIGGMGIINTYARLILLYNNNLTFTIGNAEEGAQIIIRSKIQ